MKAIRLEEMLLWKPMKVGILLVDCITLLE